MDDEECITCERLLGLAVSERSIMDFGECTIALSVLLLVKPEYALKCETQKLRKVRTLANQIINLWTANEDGN
jgi:hypothetical protein